jgi:hypothetical protein
MARPDDRVLAVSANLGPVRLVTTDAVLTEVLAAVSGLGSHMRRLAVDTVRRVLADPEIT